MYWGWRRRGRRGRWRCCWFGWGRGGRFMWRQWGAWGMGNMYNAPYVWRGGSSPSTYDQNYISGNMTYNVGGDILSKAKIILDNAVISSRKGIVGGQIIYQGRVVGHIWENVKLRDLEIGAPFYNNYYWSVPLMYKGKIVGYLYL
ncbi:MAG: hypothetical protein Q6363_005820 [Candidatus Njordarchaeota archaeon]